MDLAKVIRQLHEELDNIDAAILSLEKLQETSRRRGRPPAWLAEVNSHNKNSRKTVSPKPKPGRKEPRHEPPRDS